MDQTEHQEDQGQQEPEQLDQQDHEDHQVQRQQTLEQALPQDPSEVIDILVTDPQMRETQFNKFTIYVVKGRDRNGPFEVQRRFTEFYAVREVLVTRWPACFVPRLPGKKMFQGSEKKVVEDRLKFLNAFCTKLAKLTHLFYSTEFNQIFLRSKDGDIVKTFSGVTRNTPVELIQKYQMHFPQLQGRDLDAALTQYLTSFTAHVRKSLDMLRNYKQFVREVVENQNELNQALTFTVQSQLVEYELQMLSQYVGRNEEALIFANPKNREIFDQKFHVSDLFRVNNLQIFLDLIRLEIKDCKAFIQQISIKEDYEKKRVALETRAKELQLELQSAMQGKQSLKSMFAKGTIEEYKAKIQQQLTETNTEIENTKFLIDLMTAIIGFIEVEQFKREKQTTYQTIMSTICQLELESIKQQQQFWQFVKTQSDALLQ